MMRKATQALRAASIFAMIAVAFSARASDGAQVTQTEASTCVACHQKQDDRSVSLYAESTHAKSGFRCSRCHGGDPKAGDKAAAHKAGFVGKPSMTETLAMCGSCHTTQLATFKTSLHFPERIGAARMSCVDCHGAHLVGAASREFSFALYCTDCHGLEYLPALPRDFQRLLALVDEQKQMLARLESDGRRPTLELIARRKEIRRQIGQIVHATDLRGGLERLSQILKLGDEFKAVVEREAR
ncbi:MAG: cytochrome c3 family protein [Blastocatellia bacterium]